MEIPENDNNTWPIEKVKTSEILLDTQNPRLNLSTNSAQAEIRRELFKSEKIIDLIESIFNNSGLFPGENIILMKENDKYRVLEGNRRVCAVQCILDSNLAPAEFREDIEDFKQNSDMDLRKLEYIQALISPNWEAAQPIITARHSQYQIEKWSYLSKWRRDYTLYLKSRDTKQVAETLGEPEGEVISNLKRYAFIRYILEIQSWNNDERQILSNNDLPVSILAWHMSQSLIDTLGISFSNNYDLETSIDKRKFEYVFIQFAKHAFLGAEPKISTRTSKEYVSELVQEWIKEFETKESRKVEKKDDETKRTNVEAKDTENKGTKNEDIKTRKPRSGPPEHYFTSLSKDITVSDQRLRRLTYELANNNMKDKPAAGTLLIRALIESSITYRIQKYNLENDLKRTYQKDLPDIKLSELLAFAINKSTVLFKDGKYAKKSLEKIQSDHRDYLNSIVHGSWLDPNAGEIERIAGTTRELLRTILTDSP
jgi:hypothetical protein